MVYVLGLVVVTAAIAGILPALHATRRGSGADLRQLGGSTGIRLGRMWNALIVVQIAFAVAVLPAAIKIGIKEARSSLTGPNYPAEEFVGFAVATGSGANPLGHRLLDLKRRLQARARGRRCDVYRLPAPARQHRPDRGGRFAGGRRARDQRVNRVTTFGIDTDYLDVYGLRRRRGTSVRRPRPDCEQCTRDCGPLL